MTKLTLKETDLSKIIIPNLEYAIDKLNSAVNEASKLAIPNDFKYSKNLIQLLEDIASIRNNINSIKEWLYQSNIQIDNTLKELENELNTIKNIEIKKRESAIK